MRVFRTVLTAALCAFIACDSTTPNAGGIDAGGGTAGSANGAALVVIPPGALPANTSVTVTPVTSAPANPGLVSGAVYEFGPTGTTFAVPVAITIKYDPANIPAGLPESSLQMYTYSGSTWTLVAGSTVDVATHTVTGSTTHFSPYAPMGAQPVSKITVSGATTTMVAGTTLQLAVVLQDAGSNVLTGRAVTWASSDVAVATVSATGLVTSLKSGTVSISATSEGKTTNVTLAISPIPVASVSVSPASPSIVIGTTKQLTATASDANSNVLGDRTFTWASSDATIATVSSTGLVTGVAAGSATMTATADGKSGTTAVTVTVAPVATVEITPASPALVIGATTTLAAVVKDVNGTALSGRAVTWASSDPTIATVSAAGLVTGLKSGSASISATSEGKTTSVTLVVSPTPVVSVSVSPQNYSTFVGTTIQMNAVGQDVNGNALTGRSYTWASSDATIGRISATGSLTGLTAGTVSITATTDGISGKTQVTFNPAPPVAVATVAITPAIPSVVSGGTIQLTATLADANGNALSGRVITWSSADETKATVSATGLVTSLAVGTVNITATSEGKSATVALNITAAQIATITVTPAAPAIVVGTTTTVTALVQDANGNTLTGRAIAWTSQDATIATVSSAGLVTALKAGGVNIIATSEGKTGSGLVIVTPIPVNSVSVTPANPSFAKSTTKQLSAVANDANGNPLPGHTFTWASSDVTVATVSSTGLVTGVAPGTASIVATTDGISGKTQVTITAGAAVASVAVTPANPIVPVGLTSQLTATLADADGVALTGRTITWSSSDVTKATVSTTGLVTGVAVGTATMTATSEGISATTVVTVTVAPVATVEVTPTAATVATGGTSTLTAVMKDANGNVLAGRVVTWGSSSPSTVSVSSAGVVTGLKAGTANITATSEGKFGVATITVTAPPVASVSVTPAGQSAVVGATIQLAAAALDANSNQLGGNTFTWTSSDATIATVSSTGLVVGVAAGTATITATTAGISGTTQVTITTGAPGPIATIVITPATPTVVTAATLQLTATPQDANGTALTGKTITWSSSNTATATVSSAGLVTGVFPGTVTITATSGGKSGTTTVMVVTPPVATVTVTPTSGVVYIGQAVQYTAVAKDANGKTVAGHAVAWTSANKTIATVSGSGAVQGVATGTTTITATVDGKVGTATAVVSPEPVFTVDIIPPVSNIATGDTAALSVNTSNSGGVTLPGRVVTWTSSDVSKATVSATGVVTGVAAGSATITATSEGKTKTSAITVANPAPATTVPISLLAISQGEYHACGLDASGAAWCWGSNGNSALGDNTATDHLTPVAVVGGKTFVSIGVDVNLSCGITAAGELYCWGGGGPMYADPSGHGPPVAVAPGITFASVSVGADHTCGVATDGAAYCAGINTTGRLGTGLSQGVFPDSKTLGVGHSFLKVGGGLRWKQLSVSNVSTCGITTAGALYCWGTLSAYLSGTGVPANAATPVLITNAVAFASLTPHLTGCGLTTTGAAYCVGGNLTGVGGTTTSTNQTAQRIGGTLTFKSLSATACGIGTDDALYCWGDMPVGSGTAFGGSSKTPVAVMPGTTFSSVAAGTTNDVCAVTTAGAGYCWGDNFWGQLGDGTKVSKAAPTLLPGGLVFRVP